MPNLNHTGPEKEGPKSGRKLGNCKKTEEELEQVGELGTGQGKRRHSENVQGQGRGKRLKYFLTIKKKSE